MTRYSFNQACSAVRTSHHRRRPAGVSRRQKHRQLKFEPLEDRRVMSANPVTQAADEIAALTREQVLDTEVLDAFERSSDLSQYTAETLGATQDWVVLLGEGVDAQSLGLSTGVQIAGATGIIPDTYIVSPGSGGVDALIGSLSSSADVDYFYPLVQREIQTLAVPNDPYLQNQWHLINIGQETGSPDAQPVLGVPGEDINVTGAWETVTGNGVQIGIVDTGVQLDHPDLVDNIRGDLALFLLGDSDGHGTSVAGIAAGTGNNGLGTTGVAFNAEIAPISLLSQFGPGPLESGINDLLIAQAFTHQFQEIDVFNHSWGFIDPLNPRLITDLGPLAITGLRNSVFFGRGGLGNIHVVASGNDGELDTSSQYEGFANSRYTITVTGVDHDGRQANVDGTATRYPEGGANVLVAAPTGSNPSQIVRDSNLGSGIWTTDLTGDLGFNEAPLPGGAEIDNDHFADTDFTSRFNGTSASAPIVSGVIALMLEANPNLTYRDVQHILVASARQNDPTGAAWITNVRELQYDPVRSASPNPETIFHIPESEWPNNPLFLVDRFQDQFTNGAGFTVNQGLRSYGDSGFGHGVVDASLAVEMAKNWATVGNQTSELTWTTGVTLSGKIWGAVISSDKTGEVLIPGGVTGDGDDDKEFEAFFNEWDKLVKDDPDDPDPFEDADGPISPAPVNDRDFGSRFFGQPGIPIIGMPAMEVEWVEVSLDLGPTDVNELDFLRITLVSPDGTQSELNAFGQNVPNGTDHFDGITSFGDAVGDLGTSTMVLSTNRHWGERTESRQRVGEFGDFGSVFSRIGTEAQFGSAITDQWRLVFENYGTGEININTYEVVFHGSDVSGTGRVQGSVGVDDNGDGIFSATSDDLGSDRTNFSRFQVTAAANGLSADRALLSSSVQESWAAGVIVYADLGGDGARDATDPYSLVGADGNYILDLAVGQTYNLRIDANSLDAAGLLTTANLNFVNAGPFATVTVNTEGDRLLGQDFLQSPFGVDTVFSEPDLNVLLGIPTPQPETITISGTVFADLDSNGVQDGNDTVIANADIYIDINQDGIFTAGIDFITSTDASGNYSFVGNTVPIGFYTVNVLPGTTGSFGTPTSPADASIGLFFDPEFDEFPATPIPGFDMQGIDFGFAPGGGSSTVGAISGVVFDDANGNGIRDATDGGLQNAATVYLDLDGDNEFGVGDIEITPAANGSFTFNALAAGTYAVRIEFSTTQYAQTTPTGVNPDDLEFSVTVVAGDVVTGLEFGLENLAVLDFGDLPDSYGTTLASDGARHLVFPGVFLGSAQADAELDAQLPLDGSGDDVNGSADEDGITFSTLFNGSAPSTDITITVDANSAGGYLQGWMDFNANGVFDVTERVFTDELLPAGVSVFTVAVPADLTAAGGTVYARFRYGEQGIDSPLGLAVTGEVEDFALPVVSNAIDPGGQEENGPDFNSDGKVDGFDFLAWQRGFGSVGSAVAATDGDSDNDKDVDSFDLNAWEAGFGTTQAVATTADFDQNGNTDGADLLAWQRGVGTASPAVSDGDGNNSGTVDAADLAIFEATFGTTTAPATAAAPATAVSSEPVVAAATVLPAATTVETVVATSSSSTIAAASLGSRRPLVAASVADATVSTPVARVENGGSEVASLVRSLQFSPEAGIASLRRDSGSPFRTFASDTTFDQSVDTEDLGFTLRDRILDILYAKRQESSEERFERVHENESEIEDSFALALGEETDWRFGAI